MGGRALTGGGGLLFPGDTDPLSGIAGSDTGGEGGEVDRAGTRGGVAVLVATTGGGKGARVDGGGTSQSSEVAPLLLRVAMTAALAARVFIRLNEAGAGGSGLMLLEVIWVVEAADLGITRGGSPRDGAEGKLEVEEEEGS